MPKKTTMLEYETNNDVRNELNDLTIEKKPYF